MQNFPFQQFDDAWARAAETRALREQRRKKRLIGIAVIGSVAALLAVAVVLLPRLGGDDPASAVATTRPTTAPTATVDTSRVDLNHPYDGTPAASWFEGEAGIVLPAAAPVGRYSAEQVAYAMERAKLLITLSRLNAYTIRYHDAEPALKLLASIHAERDIRPLLVPGDEEKTWWLLERVHPDYELLPVKPRVNGSMTVALNEEGELVVHTDYLIAYAFHTDSPPKLTDYFEIISVVRDQVDYLLVDDQKWTDDSQGMWIGDAKGFAYSVNCELGGEGFLAPNYSNPPSTYGGTPDTRSPESYFDPTLPIATGIDC
ncbi:hypothetical protein [Nocardia sp. IFM 10818]